MIKQGFRLLVWATVLAGVGQFARADTYSISAIFNDGATATGTFTCTTATTCSIVSYAISGSTKYANGWTATGSSVIDASTTYNQFSWTANTKEELNFCATTACALDDTYLLSAVIDPGTAQTITIIPSGGNIGDTETNASVDCPGCGILSSGTITDTTVTGGNGAVPEPVSGVLLLTVIAVVGLVAGKERLRRGSAIES
jgi:hypothetical protein